MSGLKIKKSSGELEPFDVYKLKQSLIRSHASIVLADEIATKISKKITEGMPTSEIYKKAFDILKKRERKTAMRYAMRRSVLSLGPTGFPFEKFIAKILEKKGYKTANGVVLDGKCISHEIDVIAYDHDDVILAEIKFHNSLGYKTDTKVGLYVKARFDDLKDELIDLDGKKRQPTSGIIITNTKFTTNVINYARCAGLGLIGWDYPRKGNLYDLIEETKLQPLTCTTELSNNQKMQLIENDIINCRALLDNVDVLKKIGLSNSKIEKVLAEVQEICSL